MKIRKLIQSAQFLQGVLSGETAHAGPFFVTLDVTERCNLYCRACPYHSPDLPPTTENRPPRDIPYELVLRLCDEMKAMGGWRLLLIGHGEPLLHPRISDIITAGKTAGLEVFLTTNGTFLDEERARSLVASGLDKIQVSLWANSREDYVRNHPGTRAAMFDQVVRGVELLVKERSALARQRPRIVLHQPITRYDYQNIGLFADLAMATGCDGISFSPMTTFQGTVSAHALSDKEVTAVCGTLEQLRTRLRATRLSHNIGDVLGRYRDGSEIWKKYGCYIGWIDARVRIDGGIAPCNLCELSLGNLQQNSLQEIWNGPGFREFRQKARTPQGLRALAAQCDCEYCCHLPANRRLHPFFRMLAPLAQR
jgi:MoaA/NifB/PqqE/SkfB family radical SAM enzyme